jgi:hypothetical protein
MNLRANISAVLLLFTFTANGQTEKLIVPSDLKQQTIVTEPLTLQKGFFRAGTLINYRIADRLFNNSGQREYYRNTSWGSKATYGLIVQYGISDRLQIDIISEYLNNKQEIRREDVNTSTNTTVITTDKQAGLGFGDSHIALKYQLLTEKGGRTGLAARLKVTIPTGEKNPKNIKSENQYDLPVGDGTYALSFSMSARRLVYPYSFSGFLSFTYSLEGEKKLTTADISETSFRPGNLLEAGLSVNLHLNEWIVLRNEANIYREQQGSVNGVPNSLFPESWALAYEPSLIFQVHRFRLGESVRIPLKGRNVPADPLFQLSAQYVF